MWKSYRNNTLNFFLLFISAVCRPFNSKATDYGRRNESIARRQYEGHLGVKVQPTGLTLMPNLHYIGATADGIVNSTAIEIKCPFRAQGMTIDELIESGYEHVEKLDSGNLVLKKSSPYFCQVQGEMAIKGCELCHFILWTPTDLEIISVPFDHTYWSNELLPKLQTFFNNYVRPELITVT
jgi:YqaJ-like viral recombinase domain